jgi:hypothetical protein
VFLHVTPVLRDRQVIAFRLQIRPYARTRGETPPSVVSPAQTTWARPVATQRPCPKSLHLGQPAGRDGCGESPLPMSQRSDGL